MTPRPTDESATCPAAVDSRTTSDERRKAAPADRSAVQRAAMSIQSFCDEHDISKAFYYKLPFDLRPDEIRLGRRVIISREAAAAWRERMSKRQSCRVEE